MARGDHRQPRRPLSATREQWDRWDKKARRAGVRWAAFTRALLDGAPPRPVKNGAGVVVGGVGSIAQAARDPEPADIRPQRRRRA